MNNALPLTDEAKSLLAKIYANIQEESESKPRSHYKTCDELREQMAEIFAEELNLGLPSHLLPKNVVKKDYFSADLNYSTDRTQSDYHNNWYNHNVPVEDYDHPEAYYSLVHLESGNYIAICTALVSMPYNCRSYEKAEIRRQKTAESLGLYSFYYDEWSWHYPTETGLILYTHKTPVATRLKHWNKSFRKWVIEHRKLLSKEFYDLEKVISEICDDTHFPPHIQSFEAFRSYLGYEAPIGDDFKPLFRAWKTRG